MVTNQPGPPVTDTDNTEDMGGHAGPPRVECDFMFLTSRVHLVYPGLTIFNMVDRQAIGAALCVKAASEPLVKIFLAVLTCGEGQR